MIAWLVDNLATIIICLVLLSVVVLIIRSMVKDKRNGKGSCGCGCGNCPSAGMCHSKK